MLAVRGPRGTGLAKAEIIATFERRLENHPDFEFAEAIRNVHRVAELRLDDRFAARPVLGEQAWDCAELLARHSDPGFAENGQLTVTYLTDAHRACAAQLVRWMRECGFDSVKIDAVGNVVGVYGESEAGRQALPCEGAEGGPAHAQEPAALDRIPLRHGEKRRPLRRPARHLRADDLRPRAEPRRPAPAVRDRAGRLRRGGRPALQGDLPRLGRARRPVRDAVARPGRRRRRDDARGDAPRRPGRRRRARSRA